MEKSLYQITAAQQELFNLILECDGEITPDVEKSLKINKDNFETKARGYIWQIKKLEADNITIDEELNRLERIQKRNNKLIDKLKESMKNALIIFGDSQKVDTFTLSLLKSKAVDIVDADSIPAEYRTITTTEIINKTEIKKAIESGVKVAGATIKENQNLQIK